MVDTVSGATPLAAVKAGESVNLMSLFIGNTKGTIGETSALAILIGAAILLATKVIDLRVPLTYIGTFAVLHCYLADMDLASAILQQSCLVVA